MLELVEQLATISDSRVRARALGGDQFIGWGLHSEQSADLFDRLTRLILAALGQKTPDSMLYPRPESDVEKPVGTVAEFDTAAFLAGRW